jgi:hypothetical protein
MNRVLKLTSIFILSLFLLSAVNSPAPVAAQESATWDPMVVENAEFVYNISDFRTASGATSGKVALGGGPMEFGNETPVSLGGHFVPVERPGADGNDPSTYRNVITLGEGYTLHVKIDTRTPAEEEDDPDLPALITAGFVGEYNPSELAPNVFVHTMHKTLVQDAAGNAVTTKTTAGTDVPTYIDPKLTQAFFLPTHIFGNETFYELGAAHPEWHWIGVSSFTTATGTFGWWTYQFQTESATETPLDYTGDYEVGWVATDVNSGIAQKMRIVNEQMLTWMSTSESGEGDPLVSFEISLVSYPELPDTKSEEPSDDSPGFEIGIALFSIATIAVVARYYKRK